MDEKGYGSIIGTAALVLALLFSLSIFASSFESTYDEFTGVKDERSSRMVDEIQTDLRIDKVTNNGPDNLKIIVKNTGSTELSKSNTNLIINGMLYPENNTEKIVDKDPDTDIWLPEENLRIITENIDNFVKTGNNRIKVISEYGVSDYENIGGVISG